ncbi:MAG: Catalase related subgroup [Alphaproteobacteria bacterium]|jgi:catalase|nr:Catalase related subgroup [Alphaproteobacteria bacterium]MDB5740299.1 Catalase related subgroup [Alphaproteobacteria bacterium]
MISQHRLSHLFFGSALLATTLLGDPAVAQPAKETPLSMVNALHTAFGEHHARAVHTKGLILEGSFTPAAEAKGLVKMPVFHGATLPVIARFSVFAGVPTLPDNDDGAAPSGFAFKVKAADGDDFDVEANQHKDFIVRTFDEFALFLRAVGATKADTPHPNPVEQFLASHPHAKDFLGSLTYPASYAQAKYFGVNAVKFTNNGGKSAYVRYLFVPRAGENYLSPEDRKARSGNYLHDEIRARIAREPVIFDWYAQIAAKDDAIDDPATAWPDTRKRVKLGTITLNRVNDDAEVDRTLLFLPGQVHAGVAPADPMLVMRNTAYPISLGQRQ